jgi:hypothetical protein
MMRQRVYDTIAIGKWLALIGVTAALLCGCAAHVATTNGAPPRAKATPLEQALAYNDSLAQANKSVAQGVVNATNVTPPLIPVPTANRILIAQSRIADFDRQLTPLLVDTATVISELNAAKIQESARRDQSRGRADRHRPGHHRREDAAGYFARRAARW